MGFSVKLAACVGLGTLLAAPAVAPVAAAPALVAAHPGFAHPALPRIQRVGPGADGRVGRRFPRYGYGDGYLGAAGFGLDGTGYDAQVIEATPRGYVPPIAPRPACPMIIKIGPGLEHPVRTQVIYGAPACE